MLVGYVSAESKVTSFYTVTNKCVVVKDNKVVVPVTVRVDNDKLKLSKLMKEKLIEHKQYIHEYGIDMPEVKDWKWEQ